ncbi:STAS domain-containing protein [Aestuariibacter sp. AA17]|uniref:STAS domain-containing protein n=1 Tax=Fluctibacter corallii TaxID=2984329 RepID=A0ABT3A4P4_9ALTE|nr:STAS domain-containing protein [Aestuariibacter sp. AA17]MCV2883649.1 STAS domain-containing protein [Aestuariibacter sp. AA17]
MSSLQVIRDQDGIIELRGAFNRTTVTRDWSERKKHVLQAVKSNNALVIDMTEVVKVDSATLATMIELTGFADAEQISLSFKNVPDSLRKLADISDATSLLPLE